MMFLANSTSPKVRTADITRVRHRFLVRALVGLLVIRVAAYLVLRAVR
jgi:hypothetical protein